VTGSELVSAASGGSSYERLLSWASIAPVLLLLVLLIEWEMLRTQGARLASFTRLTLGVVAAPLGSLVVLIGLVRAVKLVG
jgi:hypothetical protein